MGQGDQEYGTALHRVCANAHSCWRVVPDAERPAVDCPESQIYRPWVGESYERTHLLVLGLNMNGAGGYDIMEGKDGVPRCKEELMHSNRILANPEYRGTYFEARMLACAWAVLLRTSPSEEYPLHTRDQILEAYHEPGHHMREALITGYDWIALTNVVKCSPMNTPNGSPTDEMCDLCPTHVLRREIEILRPQVILSLGGGAQKSVDTLRGSWRHINTIHPAAYGYRIDDAVATILGSQECV